MDFRKYQQTVKYIKSRISAQPHMGIILGSGPGNLADEIANPTVIPHSEAPSSARSIATGRKGSFISGTLGSVPMVVMQGRFHYYEGYPMEVVTLPVRVMKLLDIEILIVSSAVGGINPNFHVGDLIIIRDHINMLLNPLIGLNNKDFGVHFPDMTRACDRRLVTLTGTVAQEQKLTFQKGAYVSLTGPSYEASVEYKYWRAAGADVVDASTTLEMTVARHAGICVFGVSVITNEGWYFEGDCTNDGNEVVATASTTSRRMGVLIAELIARV